MLNKKLLSIKLHFKLLSIKLHFYLLLNLFYFINNFVFLFKKKSTSFGNLANRQGCQQYQKIQLCRLLCRLGHENCVFHLLKSWIPKRQYKFCSYLKITSSLIRVITVFSLLLVKQKFVNKTTCKFSLLVLLFRFQFYLKQLYM